MTVQTTPQHIDKDAALFTLCDRNGRVLLQHRTDDAKVLPGHWGFFGGGCEPGEPPDEAVVREAEEELGIALSRDALAFLGRFIHPLGSRTIAYHVYCGRLAWPVETLRRQQTEGQGLGMFSASQIGRLRVASHDQGFLNRVFEYIGGTPGVGPWDPEGERAAFLGHWRSREPLGAPTPSLRIPERSDIAIISLGNVAEAHGPALPADIDDRIGSSVAVRLACRTGARYLGHSPYATDGLGAIARAWSPDVMEPHAFIEATREFCAQLLTHHRRVKPVRAVLFVSGHGGNNVLGEHLDAFAEALGVERCWYALALRSWPRHNLTTEHAGAGEHAMAAALGCLDPEAYAAAAALPRGLQLQRYPAWGGMAGFYVLGDARFDVMRGRYRGVKASVRAHVEEGPQRAVSSEVGGALLERTVEELASWLDAKLSEGPPR